MGTTKSVLSMRIRQLEERLAMRLFDRTTRRLSMTEAGRVYYHHARRILDEAIGAENALQLLKGEPRGQLRVSTTVNFATLFLAEALPAFRARYPGITVEILAEEAVVDPVIESVDVCVRFASHMKPGTVARKIAAVEYVLCAAPAYIAERGLPARPEDLCDHAGLWTRNDGPEALWSLRREDETVQVPVPIPIRTNSGIVVRALAMAGNGIAILNRLAVVEEFRRGTLVPVLPDWRIDGVGDPAMWIVLPDNRTIPPKVRAFVDFIVALLAERDPEIYGEAMSFP
jgi:DNA-binding transcriptional LysR family regulator